MSFIEQYLEAATETGASREREDALLTQRSIEMGLDKEECARMLLVAREGAKEWLRETLPCEHESK